MPTKEQHRIAEITDNNTGWRRWGPYRQRPGLGHVREDYSPNGDAWGYLPHDLARSKAYRWGEDGIAGISDRYQFSSSLPPSGTATTRSSRNASSASRPTRATTARTSRSITSTSTTRRRTPT